MNVWLALALIPATWGVAVLLAGWLGPRTAFAVWTLPVVLAVGCSGSIVGLIAVAA